jgi:hypothetical protein
LSHHQDSPRISVALATYNGEKYLPEQLRSLAQQSRLPCELVVCDDGSTDATAQIVEQFRKAAPFQVRLYINDRNLGYSDNFLKAARLCEGEWVAFCDQDDVWLGNKLKDAAEAITTQGASLVLQHCYLCKEDLQHEGRIFPSDLRPGIHEKGSLPELFIWPGFLQTVPQEWFSRLPNDQRPIYHDNPQAPQPHDQWTCMVAKALGRTVVLKEPAAFYRRHPSALSGGYKPAVLSQKFKGLIGNNSIRYSALADAMCCSAEYLRSASDGCADGLCKKDLLQSAEQYEHVAKIFRSRASLYANPSMAERIEDFRQILREGGYRRGSPLGMGPRSAVKDLAAAFGLISLRRPK